MEQELIAGLMARGLPEHVAQGVVSRMRAESGLNPGINERAPTVKGSRGGYGLNQWTGPRRVEFEKFAAKRGAALDDVAAQLDFTVWELQNTEKGAGRALMAATTADEAARVYMEKFLRPGTPHRDMARFGYRGIKPSSQPSVWKIGTPGPAQAQEPPSAAGILASALSAVGQSAPPQAQILPIKTAAYAPTRRDVVAPYLTFINSLR